ncbi:isocitrate lyase/PEP mutase family protein [Ramlibacter sp.]|uniref:isocitrate lyase/PEP mutase family protein n=1 Tax=Ramlibacter sp. TaxID=1917967 RepID=UPI003D0AE3C1
MPKTTMPARLRELLARPGILTLPGTYDCIGSRLIASEGFEAFYMTGAGTAAARTGRPDVGLITVSEMADNAARMAGCVDIPLITDADTGYGNVLNMMRTVELFERAGVAGIQIEDQVFPKKCGHYEGKQIVSADEMVQKIKVAVDTRRDADLVVIARTDAIAVTGFEDALERAHRYEEAGADVLFVEAPRTMEQLRTLGKSFGKPLLYNMAISGKTPFLSAPEMEALGFKIALFAGSPMYMYAHVTQELLRGLKQGANLESYKERMLPFADFWKLMGMDDIAKFEGKYGAS